MQAARIEFRVGEWRRVVPATDLQVLRVRVVGESGAVAHLYRNEHPRGVVGAPIQAVVVPPFRVDLERTDGNVTRIGLVGNAGTPVHIGKAGESTRGIRKLIGTVGRADETASVGRTRELPCRVDAAGEHVDVTVLELLFPAQLGQLPLALRVPVALDLLDHADIVRRDAMPVIASEGDSHLAAFDTGELAHVEVGAADGATTVRRAEPFAAAHAGRPVVGPDEAQRYAVVTQAIHRPPVVIVRRGLRRLLRQRRVGRALCDGDWCSERGQCGDGEMSNGHAVTPSRRNADGAQAMLVAGVPWNNALRSLSGMRRMHGSRHAITIVHCTIPARACGGAEHVALPRRGKASCTISSFNCPHGPAGRMIEKRYPLITERQP